jgi:hypothetical protein
MTEVNLTKKFLRRLVTGGVALAVLAGEVSPLAAALCISRPARADTPAAGPAETPSDVAPDAVAVTDPAAIRAKLDDTTVYGRYYDGEDWIEYHMPDGRTAYWEKGCTYPGKWWEENGQVCYAYPNYRDGAPNCFLLFVRPDGGVQFVAISDGGGAYLASFSLKVDHGNTANLPIGGLSPCVGV